jgi:hypothetical protein
MKIRALQIGGGLALVALILLVVANMDAWRTPGTPERLPAAPAPQRPTEAGAAGGADAVVGGDAGGDAEAGARSAAPSGSR